MAIERVCVLGAGTIGSLLAAHLARKVDVTVLVRRREHAEAINRDGLRVSGKADFVAPLHATTDPAELPDCDLVIVAVKATQLEAAARALAGRQPGAVVMTVQNGLGAEEAIAAAGDWPIVSGVTFMSGVRHGDAHCEYELDTATWMGPWAGTRTRFEIVREIERLLVAAGLSAEAFPDLQPAQWSKLIFNAAVNGVSALTGLPHVKAFAERETETSLGHIVRGIMDEGRAVARTAGVTLHEDPWEMNVRAVSRGETEAAGGAYAHMPSMLEDVNAHRETEIDWICGAIVRYGRRFGVPTPLNAAVWQLVKGREASWELERQRATMEGALR